jgi:hypothetical protein
MQNEIQDMHWFSFQITILVHITYHQNLTFDPTHPESKILKEVHYYICDEKEHDTLYVQYVFRLKWDFVRERGCLPKCHIVWSDGCNGQFKSARLWYFMF